ncbi:MAG: hypothetical protein PHV17_03545 [Candidatus Omnitrophica bacterium]|nr:hypothetical protein [Candidatus Omnitrophota bacterium]
MFRNVCIFFMLLLFSGECANGAQDIAKKHLNKAIKKIENIDWENSRSLDFKGAMVELNQVIELDPECADAYYYRGYVLILSKGYTEVVSQGELFASVLEDLKKQQGQTSTFETN